MEKIPMTAEGYSALESELKHCQQIERPRIIQQITDARTHGDLSENAEYHAAKESQSLNEGRIAERSIARPRDVEMALHVPSLWPLRCPIRLSREISLQRTNLEVTPEIGPDALRCSDGPRKSGVVRYFMQEGCPA